MVKALNYKAWPLYPAQISQFESGEGATFDGVTGLCKAGEEFGRRSDRR